MTLEFNYAELEEKLRDATSNAYSQILQLTSSEHLYVFGLYTLDEASYIYATANTEEGLTRKAEEYSKKYGGSVESNKQTLIWSPCDWEYHLRGEELFQEIDSLLQSGWDAECGQYVQDIKEIEKICIKILTDLRNETNTPDNILFNLFKGDQSDEEMIIFAGELNSRDTVTRFQFDLKRSEEIIRESMNSGN